MLIFFLFKIIQTKCSLCLYMIKKNGNYKRHRYRRYRLHINFKLNFHIFFGLKKLFSNYKNFKNILSDIFNVVESKTPPTCLACNLKKE